MPNGIKLHIRPLLRIKHYALSIFNSCALCIVNCALIHLLIPNSYLNCAFRIEHFALKKAITFVTAFSLSNYQRFIATASRFRISLSCRCRYQNRPIPDRQGMWPPFSRYTYRTALACRHSDHPSSQRTFRLSLR